MRSGPTLRRGAGQAPEQRASYLALATAAAAAAAAAALGLAAAACAAGSGLGAAAGEAAVLYVAEGGGWAGGGGQASSSFEAPFALAVGRDGRVAAPPASGEGAVEAAAARAGRVVRLPRRALLLPGLADRHLDAVWA